MSNLINSMTNDKLKQINASSESTKSLGKLAKLINEMKLIEGLQPIKITSSHDIVMNKQPAQLLEARTSNNKAFSLILDNNNAPKVNLQQASLRLNSKTNELFLQYQGAHPVVQKDRPPVSSDKINNLENNILNPKSTLPKHYQDIGQTTRPLAESPTQKVEAPVTLASKVEYISILSKASNTAQNVQANTQPKLDTSSPSKAIYPPPILSNTKGQPEQTHSNVQFNNLKPQEYLPERNVPSESRQTPATQPTQASFKPNNSPNISLSENETTTSRLKPLPNSVTSKSAINETSAQQNISTPLTASGNQVSVNLSKENKQFPSVTENNTPLITTTKNQTNAEAHNEVKATKPSLETNASPFYYNAKQGDKEFIIQSLKPIPISSSIPVFIDNHNQLQLLPSLAKDGPSNIENALAKSLPQKLDRQNLVQLIQTLTMERDSKNLNPDLDTAIKHLIKNLPQAALLEHAPSLKLALANSGLFFENNLASTSSHLQQDIKGSWIQLQNKLLTQQEVPPHTNLEILDEKTKQQITQAIERISSSQLRHLLEANRQEGLTLPLVIELPVQNKGETSLLQLHINQDKSQASEKDKKRKWLAKLLFDFPETGKFEARVSLEAEKVSVIFVAQEQLFEKKIKQSSHLLAKRFEEKGLDVLQIDSFFKPIDIKKKTSLKSNLIDVRT